MHGSKLELNIGPSFRIYGNREKMGMQHNSKAVTASSLAEYCGKAWDTFRKAPEKCGLRSLKRADLVTEEEAVKLCAYYGKQIGGVDFFYFPSSPSWGKTGTEYQESASSPGNEPTEREAELSKRLESVKREREEYRTELAEVEAKNSDLTERLERANSDLSEIKRKAEKMEANVSSLSEKHQSYVLENAERIAAANQFAAEFQHTKAALSQANGTISTLSEQLERVETHYKKSQIGWAGFTLNDAINTGSMLVFIWASWSVLSWIGLFASTLGAMYMARTVRNMKASLNEDARTFGFWVCFVVEIVAGGFDYLGFYKVTTDLKWLPFPDWMVAIFAALFVVFISVSALYTTKKENEY